MADLTETLAAMRQHEKYCDRGHGAYSALLSAVENVLALHRKGVVSIIASDGSLTDRVTCLCCTGIDEGDTAPPNEVYLWPCPTVKALTDALGGDDE